MDISIIVPVHNNEMTIDSLLDSLLNQSYPNDKYEIIMVDNNSSDNTRKIISNYPVTLLDEQNIQSSYAARNRGVRGAKGKILAFTDGDCIPDRYWIATGIEKLLNTKYSGPRKLDNMLR